MDARRRIRAGEIAGHTSGLAPGFVQGNLVVLPEAYASEFLLYCQRNPKPCPLLAVGDPGDASLPSLGLDIDVRTDVPRFRIWHRGLLFEETDDASGHWREDLVTFVLGCSFSFEHALIDEGIELRHVERNLNVAMYRTNLPTVAAGRFSGPLVVSMRPMRAADAIRAIQITSRYAAVHGAPVHFGDPAEIGITDLARPDFGDAVEVLDGEVPVFWACGVTPQVAVTVAKPDVCITHAPGAMLITDLRNAQICS
jgi:uncharacterized protein YcsI (UPF0317 family)